LGGNLLIFLHYLHIGGHFRQVGAKVHGFSPVVDRAELPCHRNPPGNEPGGEAVTVPTVQGFPKGTNIFF
jgi:hypothetical protein